MSDGERDIRDALARALASDGFLASPNLGAFLSYVVEETLAGRAERLKAYTIAVAALDRPESFDPNDSALVRVQARRLRTALERYYGDSGRDDPLRITLPLGSYVPTFERAPAPTRAPLTAARRHILVAAICAFAAALAVTLWLLPSPLSPSPQNVADSPASPDEAPAALAATTIDEGHVLPLLVVEIETRGRMPDWFDADLYRRRIEDFAYRFDDTAIVSQKIPDGPSPVDQQRYRLRFTIVQDGGTTTSYHQLVHVGDERVAAAGAYDLTRDMRAPHVGGSTYKTPRDLDDVRRILQRDGILWLDMSKVADTAPSIRCLVRADTEIASPDPTRLTAVQNCLETIVTQNPFFVPARTLLAQADLARWRLDIAASPDLLPEAEALLERSIGLAPLSSAPYRTLSELLLAQGEPEAAAMAARRAMELNPEDLRSIINYGSVLARIGRYEEALDYMQRAEANVSAPSAKLFIHAFLALNNLGRTEAADRYATLLSISRHPFSLLAAAIAAERRGSTNEAATAVARLVVADPRFATDLRGSLARLGMVPSVAQRLLVDLAATGLDGATHRRPGIGASRAEGDTPGANAPQKN